jgi:hypothetical protein
MKKIIVYVKDEGFNFNAMIEWKHTKGVPCFFKKGDIIRYKLKFWWHPLVILNTSKKI